LSFGHYLRPFLLEHQFFTYTISSNEDSESSEGWPKEREIRPYIISSNEDSESSEGWPKEREIRTYIISSNEDSESSEGWPKEREIRTYIICSNEDSESSEGWPKERETRSGDQAATQGMFFQPVFFGPDPFPISIRLRFLLKWNTRNQWRLANHKVSQATKVQ
jgi:hypothetical protein